MDASILVWDKAPFDALNGRRGKSPGAAGPREVRGAGALDGCATLETGRCRG